MSLTFPILYILSIPVSVVWAARAEQVNVAVECDTPELVSGRKLRVQCRREHLKRTEMRPVGAAPAFDEAGSCAIRLDRGEYRFSVLYPRDDGTIVALQSGLRPVREDTEVRLSAGEPGTVSLAYDGRKIAIDKFSVRLENTLERAEWARGEKSDAPRVILSPKQRYHTRLIGRSDERDSRASREPATPVHVALWQQLDSSRPWKLKLAKGEARRCRFRWDRSSKVKAATMRFYFPEDNVELPAEKGFLLVTNRRLFDFEYWYDLEGESVPRIHIERRPCDAESETHLLGGPFEASAWAFYIYRLGGPHERHFLHGADLHNGSGDIIRLVRHPISNISYKAEARRRDGGPMPKFPIPNAEADRLGDPGKMYEVVVSYRIDRPVRKVLTPKPFGTWKSAHFTLQAPASWRRRVRSYLDRAERIRQANWRVSSRTPPEHHEITWLSNGGNAYAGVGKGFQRMTIWALIHDQPDVYREIALFLHENLHNFGYRHSREMDGVQHTSRAVFAEFRAYHADHPEYLPARVTSRVPARQGWRLAATLPLLKTPAAEEPTSPEGPAPAEREQDREEDGKRALRARWLLQAAEQAERMGQREAAAGLYSKLVKEYPETSCAKRARERLGALRK